MADQQSSSSQASSSQSPDLSTSPEADHHPPPSPSLPASRGQCSGKPKKRPTVTPRTFTRFFTPRSSLGRGKRIGASRQALRDITASVSNRGHLRQRTPSRDIAHASEHENDDVEGHSKKRKRKPPLVPDAITGQSSPLKRIRLQSLDTLDSTEDEVTESDEDLIDNESRKEKGFHRRKSRVIDPLEPRLGGKFGWSLRREIGRMDRPRLAQDASYGFGTAATVILADSILT